MTLTLTLRLSRLIATLKDEKSLKRQMFLENNTFHASKKEKLDFLLQFIFVITTGGFLMSTT